MKMLNPVLPTTLKVIKRARDVKINREKIDELAKRLVGNLILPDWAENIPFRTKDPKTMLDYLIMLDSLNFCFWSKKEKWHIVYKDKKYDGYFALTLSLKKFFEENPKKANLNYFSKIPFKEFSSILNGEGELLFLKKRWQIARAVSSFLLKRHKDSLKFVLSADQKLSILVPKIFKEIPYFNDVAYYRGQKVYFLKRAQILAGDIWSTFEGREIGYFKDPGYLTALADYKVPQILNFFGILEYSPSLRKKIENKIIIPAGSSQEVEIRSATIWAVEYLKEALFRLGKKFNSFQIDWILWHKSQKMKMKLPYHLTKTIFY